MGVPPVIICVRESLLREKDSCVIEGIGYIYKEEMKMENISWVHILFGIVFFLGCLSGFGPGQPFIDSVCDDLDRKYTKKKEEDIEG